MTIGERIKERRISLKFSQTELADMVKISKQTLYKYENGIITNIPSDKLENIAKKLEVSPTYLMGWDNADDDERFALTSDADDILFALEKLNELGRKEAIKRVEELTYINKYTTECKCNHLTPIAAHNDNTNDEEQQRLMQQDIDEL